MNFSRPAKTRLGFVLYAAGIAITLILTIFLIWADFEASFFEYQTQLAMLFGRAAEKEFNHFSCPLAITSNEQATVTVRVTNPADRQVKSILRMSQTDASVINIKRVEERLEFSPGQTLEFSWPVQASDAAWDRFVMVRSFMIPSSPLPSMAGYCGILVINLPFMTGHQVLALLFVVGLGLILSGGWLFLPSLSQTVRASEKNLRLLFAYTLLILVGLALAVFTSWVPAGMLFLLNILLTMGVISYRLLHS